MTATARTSAHAVGMSNYRRVWVPGGTYFFTVNLLQRRRCLLVDHIDLLRDAFRATKVARPFQLLAIAMLPDRPRCVWRLPEGDADNANRCAPIKPFFGIALPMERHSTRTNHAARGVLRAHFPRSQSAPNPLRFARKRLQSGKKPDESEKKPLSSHFYPLWSAAKPLSSHIAPL